MSIYVLVSLIIILSGIVFTLVESKINRSLRVPYIIMASIVLALQSGLRHLAVGQDTYIYSVYYEQVKKQSWAEIFSAVIGHFQTGAGKDPGYLVFQKLAQIIAPNFQLFLILVAIIFFAALAIFVCRNTSKTADAVMSYALYSTLFFAFFSITGIRQTVATAIILLCYELAKKKKLIFFSIFLLMAATIHKSAIVFFGVYYLIRLNTARFHYLMALALFPVLMIFNGPISIYLASLAGYDEYGIYQSSGAYTFTFFLLLFTIALIWRMRIMIWMDPNVKKGLIVFIVAVVFAPLVWANPVAMRVVQYFSIFMMVLLPSLVATFEVRTQALSPLFKPALNENFFKSLGVQRENRFLRGVVSAVTLTLMLLLVIKTFGLGDYKFFWQEMRLGDNYRHYQQRIIR